MKLTCLTLNLSHWLKPRQGRKIGSIEEAAFKQGFIDKEQILKLAYPLKNSGYGKYLLKLIDG